MGKVHIIFRNKEAGYYHGIDEVFIDGRSINPTEVTAAMFQNAFSVDLKGPGTHATIGAPDILSYQFVSE